MAKFKLDFSIESSKDRMEAIKSIPLETLTKKELETVTNYVLYGKDEDGTSIVQRKEIQIKTKFDSYQKEHTTSLDALMESPTFDEGIFQKNKVVYKKVKPTIDREQVKDILGMKELWEAIDRLKNIYDQNSGKKPREEGTPVLNQTQLYYLNHQLIELYQQQYQLKDIKFPTVFGKKNKADFHDNPLDYQLSFPILPRGIFSQENDWLFMEPFRITATAAQANLEREQEIINSGKPYLDFRNKDHLYYLIQYYGDLKASVENQPDSIIHNLLWTLDFYIDKANLSDQQRLIVEDKKFRFQNREIRAHLEKELGISHRENYISTIWNKAIDLIIEAVELNYDEYLCKDYKKAWKKCNRCGKLLLRDPRNFVRKSKASDGLTGRCKRCDKEVRQNKKCGPTGGENK